MADADSEPQQTTSALEIIRYPNQCITSNRMNSVQILEDDILDALFLTFVVSEEEVSSLWRIHIT